MNRDGRSLSLVTDKNPSFQTQKNLKSRFLFSRSINRSSFSSPPDSSVRTSKPRLRRLEKTISDQFEAKQAKNNASRERKFGPGTCRAGTPAVVAAKPATTTTPKPAEVLRNPRNESACSICSLSDVEAVFCYDELEFSCILTVFMLFIYTFNGDLSLLNL